MARLVVVAAAGVVLAMSLATIAGGAAIVAARGVRRREPDAWSTAALAAACAFLAQAAWQGRLFSAAPWATWLAPLALLLLAAPVLFVGFDLARWTRPVFRRLTMRGQPLDEEGQRKAPHLLLGLTVPVDLWVVTPVLGSLAASGHLGAASTDLAAAWHAGTLANDVALAFLLLLLLTLAPIEFVRLAAPDADYPWKPTVTGRLRPKERNVMGAHVHIAAGLALALVVLADRPGGAAGTAAGMAVLASCVVGDAAMALVGRRWGRWKWPHDRNKSLQGSAAGVAAGFLVAVPFVSVADAGLVALCLLAVDLVAPRFLPISDNLLNPVAMVVALR